MFGFIFFLLLWIVCGIIAFVIGCYLERKQEATYTLNTMIQVISMGMLALLILGIMGVGELWKRHTVKQFKNPFFKEKNYE